MITILNIHFSFINRLK